MRADGRDIVELFGYRPDDISQEACEAFDRGFCPFTKSDCTKTNHDKTVVYGVCSVTNGAQRNGNNDVIVCPKRLYAENCGIFADLAREIWGSNSRLVLGGSLDDLRKRAMQHSNPAVAFGQNSGSEISVNSNGPMSMDWVIQSYSTALGLRAEEFIGIEVQSIDITGNYRDTWSDYRKIKSQRTLSNSEGPITNSGHGLNWANVHKRLIPQIIRKGNIYRHVERCVGFYFVVPEIVYQKFENIIGDLPLLDGPRRDRLSIRTYSLDGPVVDGEIRDLRLVRTVHHDLTAVAQAFISNYNEKAPALLDKKLSHIL